MAMSTRGRGARATLVCLILAIFALLTPTLSRAAEATSLRLATHHSDGLTTDKLFYVYTPPTEDPAERFPVLYVLHGKWGSHADWPEKGNAEEMARRYRMILVFPDGGQFNWYLNSPVMPECQYETYLTQDLLQYVDANFPTIPRREARGLMGLSMGGHGALLMAARHPDLYGSASSLSGILKLTNHGARGEVVDRLGPLDKFPQRWIENSVWDQAERFQTANVKLLFDCGEDDTKTGAIADNRQLHEKLMELKVPHIWREHRGTHSWPYWTEHLPDHLSFHQAAMLAAVEKPEKWFGIYFARLAQFFDENAALTVEPEDGKLRVVLLGSSSVQGMPKSLFPGDRAGYQYRAFNRGIGADRLGIGTRGLTKRMEESVFDLKPHVVFIKNGRNDLGARHGSKTGDPSEDRMIEEYTKIVDEIQSRLPECAIVVCTSPPVLGKYAHLAPSIIEYNKRLRKLVEEKGLVLLDLHPLLVAEEGLLLKPENSADGLHLSQAGKEIWAEKIYEELDRQAARVGIAKAK